ncbi:MAG: thermopsin family protease [Nitrososphaerales archaeon]
MERAPLLVSLIVALFALSLLGSPAFVYAHQQPGLNYTPNNPSELPACSSSQACPVGVADYGISGDSTYTYTASTFVSWVNFTNLDIGARHQMTIQQNLVAYNVTEKANMGEYWIQNVPLITQLDNGKFRIKMLDNIWNFTATGAKMKGVIHGNLDNQCTNKRDGHPSFYFCRASMETTVSLPFEIEITASSISISGKPGFSFEIAIYQGGALVTDREFDRVSFTGNSGISPVFFVGGMNPFGLYNDAETVLCGPGGGSSVTVLGVTASISEKYSAVLNGPMINVQHAYSAGADTAERVLGVSMASTVAGTGEASSGNDNFIQLW